MHPIRRTLLALVVALLFIGAAMTTVSAQQATPARAAQAGDDRTTPAASPSASPKPAAPAEDDSEVRLEPVIWLPTVDANLTIGDSRFNATKTLSGTITPSEVLPNLHFTFSGRIEGRDGRWGGFGEYYFVSMSDGAKLGTGTGTFGCKMTVAQLSGFYRVCPGDVPVDVVAGVRIGSLTNTLDFNGARIVELNGTGFKVSRTTTVIDPIIGARVAFPLSKSLFFQVYGDYGGFGIGDNQHTWRAQGVLGYDMTARTRFYLGYTAINLSSTRGSGTTTVQINNTLRGPVIGASFKL